MKSRLHYTALIAYHRIWFRNSRNWRLIFSKLKTACEQSVQSVYKLIRISPTTLIMVFID